LTVIGDIERISSALNRAIDLQTISVDSLSSNAESIESTLYLIEERSLVNELEEMKTDTTTYLPTTAIIENPSYVSIPKEISTKRITLQQRSNNL